MAAEIQNANDLAESCRPQLRKGPGPIRLAVLARLVNMDGDLSPLLEDIRLCLDDPEESVRRMAAAALPKAGAGAVEPLIEAIGAQQPLEVRRTAAGSLAGLGRDAQSAVEALIRLLSEEDPVLRTNAMIALSRIGEPAADSLAVCLTSPQESVQIGAIEALGWMGSQAHVVLSRLKTIMSVLSPAALPTAWAALAKISGQPQEGMPKLLEGLSHPQDEVRLACVERLGELGMAGEKALDRIQVCLRDASDAVRAAAALAIVRIKPQCTEAVEALAEVLKDSCPKVRTHAAIALATIGPPARQALPKLGAMRSDPDERAAGAAMAAIQRIERF